MSAGSDRPRADSEVSGAGWRGLESAPIGKHILVFGRIDSADDEDPDVPITAYIQARDHRLWAVQGLSTVEAEWWMPLPDAPRGDL